MERKNTNKSILIPVFDICNIPPLDKVVGIANNSNMNIHIAAFIHSGNEPGKLMEQTIRLTRVLKVVLHRLKGKVKSVTSKIYTTTRDSEMGKMMQDKKVKIIVSQKISSKLLTMANMDNILLLQLTKSRMNKDNDILIVHDKMEKNLDDVMEVIQYFGKNINHIYDKAIDSKDEKIKISSLNRKISINEVRDMIRKHKTECIALNKNLLKEDTEILEQNEASVLLY